MVPSNFLQATPFLSLHFLSLLSTSLGLILSSLALSSNLRGQSLKEAPASQPRCASVTPHKGALFPSRSLELAEHTGAVTLALPTCFQFHVVAMDMLPS